MKKRTFLATLLLFMLFFNCAVLWMVLSLWNDRMSTQVERGLSEHYLISSLLQKDLQASVGDSTTTELLIPQLMQSYLYLVKSPQSQLAVLRIGDDTPLFATSGYRTQPLPALGKQERLVTTESDSGRLVLKIYGALPAPYEQTVLCHQSGLDETVAAWQQQKNLLFLIGAVFSGLLAIALLLLLGRLFHPLGQISTASRQIASGDFGGRLAVKGKDELAEMSQSFNAMADEIELQMGELREASAQKQRFIDNFAHELRTPLTAIYGYAELLQRTSTNEETRTTYTEYILSQCRRIQAVAEQLLQLSALHHDSLTLDAVAVAPLFADVVSSMRVKAEARGITVVDSCNADTIMGNRELLESLLLNLLDNAVKASPPCSKVMLSAEQQPQGIVVTVTDHGSGMTTEQLSQVKEAFYRADKSRSRQDGGAGLGLALCEQIAVLHNAQLCICSAVGEGTTATVTFTS